MNAPASDSSGLIDDLRTTASVLNSLPGHIAVLDPSGVIVFVNDAWRGFATKNHLHGSDFSVGHNYIEVCEQALGDCAEEARAVALGIRRVLKGTATDFTIEYPCHAPDEQRWFRMLAAPLDGKPIRGAIVMHFNITEAKKAELAALQTAAIIQFSDDAIFTADLNNIITSWNHGSEMIFGFTADEMTGKSIIRLIPAGRQAEEVETLNKIKQGRHVEHYETKRQTADGRLIDVSVTASPIKDSTGTVVGISKIVRDISEKKRIERSLALSNARHFSLFDNMMEGYAYCRILYENDRVHDFAYLEVNKAFELLTGLHDVVGKKVTEIIPGIRENNPELFEIYGRVASTGKPEKIETYLAGLKLWLSISIYSNEKEHFTALFEDITERKKSEKSLRLQSSALEASANAIVITDSRGAIEWANPAFTSYTGYTVGEAIGQNPRLLKSGRHDQKFYHHLWETISFGKVWQGEVYNRRKDGTVYPEEMTITPVKDNHGQINHFVAVKHDISKRKHLEKELRESEAKFRGLFDGAKDAIVLIHDGRFVDCNARAEELLGLPHDQIINKAPSEISPPTQPDGRDSHEKGMELMYRVLAGEPQAYEWMHLRADGTPVCTDVSLSRLDLGGEVYLLAVARDITARKQAEKQIVHQAALLDSAQDAIVEIDLQRKTLYWNSGAERLYGWTREEVMARDASQAFYTDHGKFDEITKLTIRHGKWSGEITQLAKDQREIIVQSRRTLVRDSAGHPVSILVINTDITEKKKLEAQFFRAQRMESIGVLAGGIAHDLNNILAPILMSIDILKPLSENPEAGEILDTIKVSAQRGADIVRQVLTFSRGMEGERIEIQPKHLLRELEKIIKDTFPKDIRLQFSIPRDAWTILGDPTQVHQILLNLSVNARDAMPHGGQLTLALENCPLDAQFAIMNPKFQSGRYVLVKVSDTGTGIAPSILDRIFEPFFTTKETGKGTGLGLSTVAAIVKSHEGIIEVDSKLGHGTTFKVYLPAANLTAQELHQKTALLNFPSGHGETILVVDDEAPILSITRQTLRKFGYQVLVAGDGAEAIAVYAEHQNEIAVVLTDMMMPVMDGPATIHALRRMNPSIKIIGATGVSSHGRIQTATAAGVKHFLAKPYTAQTLLQTLRTIIEEA